MQFNRLRISGFKSFVEPTEFIINPGLTGVVGPNGCGKSNLVEALRWVMGENSPKKMRGAAMDDVIFAGTASRPSRNLAEVSLQLDNAERRAPPAFNDVADIEVTRRIEREQGSQYRINGREVRQRDVQLLFADLATGAHSPALVSQGRVGAVINAKPIERRALLEEAAGITGLHSRRHEAELRLHAAEQNLTRVDDVVGQLEQQLQGLKRQARQANRYRNISGHIRRAEAILLHLRFREATEALNQAKVALEAAEAEVALRTAEAAAALTAEARAGDVLPPLRQTEAEAAARLHRLAVARENLDAEERRANDARAQAEARLQQIAADTGREQAQAKEAADALARLESEAAGIEAARAGETQAQSTAAALVEQRQLGVGERQEVLDQLTERAAAEAAVRARLQESIAESNRRAERLNARLAEIAAERIRLLAEGEDLAASEAATAAVEAARGEAEAARARFQATEARRVETAAAETASREALQAGQSDVTRLAAEESGLARLLAVNEDDLWPPLIDAVTVTPGWEKALGAALGDDLSVSADSAAPVHWQILPPAGDAPALPEGVRPLSDVVQAPPALARRLAQIGVIEDGDGAELRRELKVGQRLVTRAGALWRWDGFTVQAGAATGASTRLEQRNRLAELRRELSAKRARLTELEAAHGHARTAAQTAMAEESAAREASRRADAGLNSARETQAAAVQKAAARASRLAALQEAAEQATRDLAEAGERRDKDQAALSVLPPEAEAREQIVRLRGEVEGLRLQLAEARAELDQLRREAEARARRFEAIGIEKRAWRQRADSAASQIAQLGARRTEAEAKLEELASLPAEMARLRADLGDKIAEAEAARSKAADALAEAEVTLAAHIRAAREATDAQGTAREARARCESDAAHAEQHRAEVGMRIREALDCAPEEALAAGGVEPDEALPELPSIELKLERLKKERDNMGPVNLRAEMEAQEVDERLTMLQTERADLIAAIDRLRQGIGALNREGRERLLAAFRQVDEHFQKLFVRVFGGGRAHLTLTESDDPLEAGLEIMAQPPGKRLQVMSLLSGGEQALTALSLLFAVFLTNPAPICVLDEVDAPLDDANVERLCDLLDEIVKGGLTRFLVVTHNPITMARMDRLFGVTMAERGVSTLVSVDLQGAEALRATA